MKKLILAFAAFALSMGMMSAQDLATATETYNKGAEAYATSNYTSALDYFKKALEMAQALGADGEEVAGNCKNAIPSVILSIGKELYNNKDFDGAVAKITEAGKVAEEYGNADVAAQVKELLPQVTVTKTMDQANDAFKTKNIAGALALYKEVMAADTANGIAALRIGQILGSTGKLNEAVSYLEIAKRNGQEANATTILSTSFLKQAAGMLKAGKYADAITLAEKANSYKVNPQAFLIAGQAAQKSGKDNIAIENFDKYLSASPNAKNAGAIAFTVGALYQKAGNKAKAVEYYKKVLTDPQFGVQAKQLVESLSK